MTRPNIPERQRIDGIGGALVDGPRSLRPPDDEDDYGWLEPAARIVLQLPDGRVRSLALFVDATAGRDEHFIPPVLRAAEWDRRGDLRRATGSGLAWPAVAVRLLHAGDEAAVAVDETLADVQRRLAARPFVARGAGHAPDARTADAAARPRGCTLRVFARDEARCLELEAPAWRDDDGLGEALAAAMDRIASLGEPLDVNDGWRERYAYDLTRGHESGPWTWDYRPRGRE
ncbi:MAG TPA: hypothetical protein VFJ74_03465 [Gemmatimonadaceae bacterium]|nr:hypothetical protein [Gemmatimonadaceae bacterium]